MNWRKIITLLLFLAVLAAAIAYVNFREKRKLAVEGVLLDFPAAQVQKIELLQNGKRFVFSLRAPVWYLEEPLAAKADKIAVESILDDFCLLKYDRLVAENAGDLKSFGLEKPEIELKLFAVDKSKPVHTILLGMKNNLDSSSYAKLARGGKVVSIASYKRNALEKDLFAFRDKKFFDLDNLAVASLSYRYESAGFAFFKKDDRWFMDKPVFSLAQEAKVGEILSAAAMLEARAFTGAAAAGSGGEFGLDKPLLAAEFRTATGSRRIEVGQKGDRYYARADGSGEICEIGKDFLEKFGRDAAFFRERKLALFYPFDVRELAFKSGGFAFKVSKDAGNAWQFARPIPGERPSEEKISGLLSALAECEAGEFVDTAKAHPDFATRIDIKFENSANPGQVDTVVMEFSGAEGGSVWARNRSLPYLFKVGKEILQKFPQKPGDIGERVRVAADQAK